ncbi:hypothetical protein [uncultured Rhodoblastus sp.]|uniref:hypothetical protein n=1 Tax=uncultured Rhodoblastus sp. TaxID=543037 RepID=UPI0025EBBACD|nr:hypothetical protein [uncultured Rhodoblastus sp.]
MTSETPMIKANKVDYSALAARFVAACRAHGHEPRVSSDGYFGIQLGVLPKMEPDEGGFSLGFDPRPFDALRDDPDYIQRLIDATIAHAE